MDDRQVKALSVAWRGVAWRAQALGQQWRLVWIQYTWQSYSTIRTYHEQKRPQHAGTGSTLALLRLAVELGAHLTNGSLKTLSVLWRFTIEQSSSARGRSRTRSRNAYSGKTSRQNCDRCEPQTDSVQ